MQFESSEVELVLFTGLTVLTVLALIVIVVLRNSRGATRLVRRRLQCPVEGRPADVEFVVLADDGETEVDGASCSLLPPGEPVGCEKVCRAVGVGRAGRSALGHGRLPAPAVAAAEHRRRSRWCQPSPGALSPRGISATWIAASPAICRPTRRTARSASASGSACVHSRSSG